MWACQRELPRFALGPNLVPCKAFGCLTVITVATQAPHRLCKSSRNLTNRMLEESVKGSLSMSRMYTTRAPPFACARHLPRPALVATVEGCKSLTAGGTPCSHSLVLVHVGLTSLCSTRSSRRILFSISFTNCFTVFHQVFMVASCVPSGSRDDAHGSIRSSRSILCSIRFTNSVTVPSGSPHRHCGPHRVILAL